MKHIVFRVDSSAQIGSGHLMRCLVLADYLKRWGEIQFICRDLPYNLNHLIKEQGYALFLLPAQKKEEQELIGYEQWLTVKQEIDMEQVRQILQEKEVDLLIVDHYALDYRWEKEIHTMVKKILVIDDLANRQHDCDFLLDQNYQSELGNKYAGLVDKNCQLYLGLEYVLLRPEFYQERKHLRIRDGQVKNILVFFGGSDDTEETMKVLQGLQPLKKREREIKINVVVGFSNRVKKDIENFCSRFSNLFYYCQVNNMAQLIQEADLAFGAAGSSTWERCFLGLPSIITVTAKNQQEIADIVDKKGVIYCLGWHSDLNAADYWQAYEKIEKIDLRKMSQEAVSLIKGNGIKELIGVLSCI